MASKMSPELAAAIIDVAKRNKWDPVDLGTVISYETGGTLDPWKAGPTTQWGQHRGLIQWGEPQAKRYGVHKDMSVTDQMMAVERYFKDRGLKEGAGLLDMYSTVNAGAPGLYNRSDANNGGAPGTVADKVNNQMGSHRMRIEELLGMSSPVGALASAPAVAAPPIGAVPAPVPGAPMPITSVAQNAPVGALAGVTPAGLQDLSKKMTGGGGEEFAPLQQLQMAQPQIGQSQQIAAALAKAYGIGV